MINGHGDEFSEELKANFSSNVWYGADNSALYNHLYNSMLLTTRYPETDAVSLKIDFATKHGINPTQLVVCNGSTEAFYLIAHAFSGKTSLIVSPTFSEYADACRMHKHQVHFTKRESLIENIEILSPNIVWLCNPNNPDGFCYSVQELKSMIAIFPLTIFVIDQAYKDFTLKESLKANELKNYPNLILVQSLTKRYSIPGLRLGCLISTEQLINKINPFRIPWTVNTLAIEAGKHILKNDIGYFPIKEWLIATKIFQEKINALDVFKTIPTETPYFLVQLKKGTAKDLKCFLLTEKILIRDATNFEGLEGEYVRLCTLSEDNNNLLISNLEIWNQNTIL
ncbi:MAG: aminotransferase class I/II-fold pyridoxal phosphate-dependent enzyme [Paludibacter sp.]|nr:aminotransferase class I/II-fold pyridoxal phosphate-dependent enzyme [Paludibacter sp.]